MHPKHVPLSYLTVGKVLLPQVTNGCSMFSRHFPSSKMSELMGTLEFVQTYINDLLCITKGSLDDHLSKLRRVFIRLRDARLKVNARNSSFCATDTEYLGYVLSWDGINPHKKKVQAILTLMPPRSVKELRRFLGMVQYYRDIWAWRSKMLAPLSNLVGECGHTKVT